MRTRRSERNYFVAFIVFFAILSTLFSLAVGLILPEVSPELERGLYGILCPAGTEVDIQRNIFTLPGETRISVDVGCINGNQERQDINDVWAFIVVGLAIPASIALALSLVLAIPFALLGRNRPEQLITPGQSLQWTSAISNTVQTTPIVSYQGKQYQSVKDMPPEARQAYERAMSFLGQNVEGNEDDRLNDKQQPIDVSNVDDNPTEKLKQLKDLLEAGLITKADYEDKKMEILSRM